MKIYAKQNENGNYDILDSEDGCPITRLENCWPLDSELSGLYEHPAGIKLDLEQVEKLNIPIEG
jgi:hypothetical protein